MPIDKYPKGTTTTKPITPALSSRFRNGKASVAPRLAGSTPSSPAVIARKDFREQTISPQAEQKEPSSLNGNITPRSGPRNLRISTESPASPATARRLSGSSAVKGNISVAPRGLGISSPNNGPSDQMRPVPNTSAARRRSGSGNLAVRDEDMNKFFRANDVRPTTTGQLTNSTMSPQPVAVTLLKHVGPRNVNSAPPSSVNVRDVDREELFVRADEANVRAPRPQLMKKLSTASTTSMNTARTRSPDLSRSRPTTTRARSNQPSPTRHNTRAGSRAASPQKPLRPESMLGSNTSPSNRRRSIGSSTSTTRPAQVVGHKKSASINSVGSLPPKATTSHPSTTDHRSETTWIPPINPLPHHDHSIEPTSPDTLSPRSASLTSSKTIGTSATSDTEASDIAKAIVFLNSTVSDDAGVQPSANQPQTSIQTQAQTEAANARRERKVLDLEISNSSLLAINKTLEKELRKQSVELRRFRRLSRSGRLSFAPSNRSVSMQSAASLDTLQEQTEDDRGLSDEEEEDESDLSGLSDETDESSPLESSHGGETARAKRRARDERRLMLDLAKHHEILLDSQKLTQSIKKCLGLTEELIKDGKQALEYKVGIGDLKLGGRVLHAEDYEADVEADISQPEETGIRQGLLSPSITKAQLQEAGLWTVDESSVDPPSADQDGRLQDPG